MTIPFSMAGNSSGKGVTPLTMSGAWASEVSATDAAPDVAEVSLWVSHVAVALDPLFA